MWYDGFVESATPWAFGALVIVIVVLFVGALTDFGRGFRRPAPWPIEQIKSRAQKAIERAAADFVSESRKNVNDKPQNVNDKPQNVNGLPQAIERARHDDSPMSVDNVLLAQGEVAVFDASGALVVWFPAPGSDVGSVVCQKSVTILTYVDMPQATPKMRDQLRVLKGGRDG